MVLLNLKILKGIVELPLFSDHERIKPLWLPTATPRIVALSSCELLLSRPADRGEDPRGSGQSLLLGEQSCLSARVCKR